MLDRVAFWLMLPVSAVQGLRLRKMATRLPGAAGARQGACGEGDTLRLLAIGDSIIDGVGTGRIEASLPVQFAIALSEKMQRCVQWRVEGESGSFLQDCRRCPCSPCRRSRCDSRWVCVQQYWTALRPISFQDIQT